MTTTIRIHAQDVLGVTDTDLVLEPGHVTEVFGPNATGKTSLALAAAAVLAHEVNPAGVAATAIRSVYRRDTAQRPSEVALSVDDRTRVVVWHTDAGKITAEGDPLASRAAVGLVDFTTRGATKSRAEALQDALLPSEEEVLSRAADALGAMLPQADIDAALNMITERGWDSAAVAYAERMREAKRAWANVTGRTWGRRVAVDWRPDGWRADYDQMSVADAEAARADAADRLTAVNRVAAITDIEAEQRDDARRRLPTLEAELDELNKAVAEAEAAAGDRSAVAAAEATVQRHADLVSRAQSTLEWTTAAAKAAKTAATGGDEQRDECPECGAALIIVDGRIVAYDVDAAEAAERERVAAVEACDGEIAAAREALSEAQAELASAKEVAAAAKREFEDGPQRALVAARSRRHELRGRLHETRRSAEREGEVMDPSAVRHAEAAVADAAEAEKMIRAECEARIHHETVGRYEAVVQSLDPTQGVRARLMSARLDQLNRGLAILAQVAEWPTCEVESAGHVTLGDRPVALCSESERWRAQAAIQLTLAAINGDAAVVLDRADVLDDANVRGLWSGVRRVAAKCGLAVLVCRTGGAAIAGDREHATA